MIQLFGVQDWVFKESFKKKGRLGSEGSGEVLENF